MASANTQNQQLDMQKQQEQTKNAEITMLSQGCNSIILTTNQGTIIKCSKHHQKVLEEKIEGQTSSVQTVTFCHSRACMHLNNEFKILKDISHVNIMQVYQYKPNQKIFMHQNPNETCCAVLMKQYHQDFFDRYLGENHQALTFHEGKQLFKGLLMGLRYLHQNNIVHNDIKPENLLYDQQYQRGVLGDFGLARKQEESNYDYEQQKKAWKNRCKTYCGPEVFMILQSQNKEEFQEMNFQTFGNDERNFTFDEKKNDIFGMGQTMFLVLTGFFPRKQEVPSSQCPVYNYIINGEEEKFFQYAIKQCRKDILWNDLKDLCVLTMKMLAFNPLNRPSCDDILKDKFFSDEFDAENY